MATKFDPRNSYANINDALIGLATFLCDGVNGPGWTIIGAYSSNNSAFETPVAGNALANLPSGNGWRTGTLVAGDYIIFQNTSAAGKFELGIEYQASDTIRFINAPYSGFDTGVGDADMTAAGNWTQPKLTTLDVSPTTTNPTFYSFVADADHLKWFSNDESTNVNGMRFFYAGKTTDNHTGHDNASVMYYYNGYLRTDNSGIAASNQWKGISTVDNATEIAMTAVYPYDPTNGIYQLSNTTNPTNDAATGEWRLYPFYIGHVGPDAYVTVWGKLIGVYGIHRAVGYMGQGTIDSKNYAWIKNSSADTGAIVIDWDGTTALNN